MKYGVYLHHKDQRGDIWKPVSILYNTRAEAEHWLKICQKSNPYGEYRIIEI